MKVSRELFLNNLQTVKPGLSPKEIIEQSACFVFKNGHVITYNDEVSCRVKTAVKDVIGAVQAKPLLDILEKMSEDEVDVVQDKKELRISGIRKATGIRMDQEILLPLGNVEKPKNWFPLHPEFQTAVKIVGQCAGIDMSEYAMTCVHISPHYVEACDRFQMCRYPIEVRVKEPILVRRDVLNVICNTDACKISETQSWVHFSNGKGTYWSFRLSRDKYKNLDKILVMEGVKATLPKGLGEAVQKAEVFSAENVEQNRVKVMLEPGRMKIRGEGAFGWYMETKKLKYKGPKMAFFVPPKLLIDLSSQHNECEIGENRIKADTGHYTFISALDRVAKKVEGKKEEVA